MANEFVARKGLISLGGVIFPYTEASANYTVDSTDNFVNCTGSLTTLSLLTAVGREGFLLTIKNSTSVDITVDPFSSESIDGLSTVSLSPGQSIGIRSNGSNWLKTDNMFLVQNAGDNRILTSVGTADGAVAETNLTFDSASRVLGLTGSIQFGTGVTYSVDISQGELRWNAEDGTLDLGMGFDNVTQQIGQEIYFRVKNQTGATIANGTPVRFAGTLGSSGTILVAPADTTLNTNPEYFMGIATMAIPDGGDGLVTHTPAHEHGNAIPHAFGEAPYHARGLSLPRAATHRTVAARAVCG
jgi:hypothetical protein